MILWNHVIHSLTKHEKKKDVHNLLFWKLKIKNRPTMVDGTSRKFTKVKIFPLKTSAPWQVGIPLENIEKSSVLHIIRRDQWHEMS